MSWLFSRALVEEFLEGIFSDGEPSALSNGNPIPQAYCAPDRMTGFSRLSRFGMTFAPLTENRGQELLTLYLAGFPARTSVLRGGGQESPAANQDFGKKWLGLLGKYDPDTHSLKTAQCSLFEGLTPSSVILPRWGLMRDGVSYQQQTLVRHTLENESGLWPTVSLPTPKATDGFKATRTAHGAAKEWNRGRNKDLGMVVALWPTVTATANQLAPSMQSRYAKPIWPTPTAHNAKETNAPSESNLHTPTLAAAAGGHLNPTWVEWLMGWPLGWTDLKPLETDKYQQWQQQHSDF